MKKNEIGITLIALVVTIVVLLILAGTSIAMLSGDNGIITQAQKAKVENRGGAVEERVALWKTEIKASEYSKIEVDTEDELLQKLLDEDLVEEDEIDRNAKKITIGSRVINYSLTLRVPVYSFEDESVIEFYIEYAEGMTWEDFVESEYNYERQWAIGGSPVKLESHLGYIAEKTEWGSIEWCKSTDKIEPKRIYILCQPV